MKKQLDKILCISKGYACLWDSRVIVLILISIGIAQSVPISIEIPEVGNNSIVELGSITTIKTTTTSTSTSSSISECRYKGITYSHNSPVPITTDPCLSCSCRGRVVVCKLRICPPIPKDPPPGCLIVERKKNCCPELVCPESRKISREQRFSISTLHIGSGGVVDKPESLPLVGLGHELQPVSPTSTGFCIHEGSVYAEGSAMKSGGSNCDHCFCIRGQMKCSSPQCVIPINGCRPKYRSNACCPTNYDCNESLESTYPTSTSTPSTVAPSEITITTGNPLSVHPPNFLKGCRVRGAFIYEGEPVLPLQLELGNQTNHITSTTTGINPCQTCFCMGGVIRCRDLECNQPIAGCTPVRAEGHCCPDRYECNQNQTLPLALTDPINLGTNLLKPELGSREERRSRDRPTLAQLPEDDEQDTATTVLPLEFNLPSTTTKMELRIDEIEQEQTTIRTEDETTFPPTLENDQVKEVDEEEDQKITTQQPPSEILLTSNTDNNNNEPPESLEDPMIESNPDVPSMAFLIDDHEHDHQDENDETQQLEPHYLSSTTTTTTEKVMEKEYDVVNLEKSPTPLRVQVPEEVTTSAATSSSMTTSNNLEFISFGLEDALLHPPDHNDNNEDDENEGSNPPLPIKITYDRDDFKSSLIPPTPPRGWKGHTGALLPNPIMEKKPIPISIADFQLQNAIMDVPISTSLYNNGYYANLVHGTTIQNNVNGSHTIVPGQVFDESSERIFEQPIPIVDNFHEHFKLNDSFVPSLGIGMEQEKIDEHPSRIYSKFGMQDSYYRRVESKTPAAAPASSNNNRVSNFEPRIPTIPRPPPYIPRDYPYYEYDDEEGSFEDAHSQPPFILIQSPPKVQPTPQKPKGSGPFIVTPEPTTIPTTTTPPPPFKPIVAFPFKVPTKNTNHKASVGGSGGGPLESLLNIGLKLSGCNIYGKMYGVGRVIEELSSPCVECKCTELGVQCSQLQLPHCTI